MPNTKVDIQMTTYLQTKSWHKLGLLCLCSFLLANFNSNAQALNFESGYVLGAGDEIRITVFGQTDLSVETRLSNVGVIRYPFLGDIKLVGRTVNEVEKVIDKGLRGDYLVNPSVSVTVAEYRPFFIDGAVNKPGGYPYQPGLTIDKAAALAGGYSQRAAKDDYVIRRNIGGTEVALEVSDTETFVVPGDIVTVKESFF